MRAVLHVCEGCGRHVRAGDARCPFCARSTAGAAVVAGKIAAVAATLAVGVALSACYGGPPRHENLERLQIAPDGASVTPAAPGPSRDAARTPE